MKRGARKGCKPPPGSGSRSREERPLLDVADLVERCLAGSEEAWSEFLRRYGNLIYATLRRKVDLGPEDLEDVFQNVIVSIYRNLRLLRDPGRIHLWIIQISYREGVNRIRANVRSRRGPVQTVDPAWLDDLSDGEPPPKEEGWLEDRSNLARAQRVQETLLTLPERCRNLLRLLFYEDPEPDYAEISRRIGIPVGSIGPTRARCLDKIRRVFLSKGWLD